MIEFLAVLTTLSCVILTLKSSIWCWPIGIISTIAYFWVFYHQHLYAEATLQVVFTIQGIFGWYYWYKNKTKKPFFITSKRFTHDLMIMSVSVVFLAHILATNTDNPQPAYDSITSLLSIYGTWYLAKKNIYGWLMFILADFFFIIMFVQQKMPWSAGLYFILLLIAFNGLVKWSKDINTV
jgi:nicotinamide mononucleotide transporter